MPRTWTWRLKRLAISAFLVVHLAALAVWNIPNCVIRLRTLAIASYYMNPLGLWQNWSMFAPDPTRHTLTLDAIAVDKNGIFYNFAFPKMSDYTILQRFPRVRHSKFLAYLLSDEFAVNREVAARHVVRRLEIPAESFPVEVELQLQVRETPPTGTLPDPMASTKTVSLKAYRFEDWKELRP